MDAYVAQSVLKSPGRFAILSTATAPDAVRRKAARLAVDKRYTGKGYGEFLLIDALVKLLQASETVAFPLVVVDVKEGVAGFYEKMGFTALHDVPNTLFMTMQDIRTTLSI